MFLRHLSLFSIYLILFIPAHLMLFFQLFLWLLKNLIVIHYKTLNVQLHINLFLGYNLECKSYQFILQFLWHIKIILKNYNKKVKKYNSSYMISFILFFLLVLLP